MGNKIGEGQVLSENQEHLFQFIDIMMKPPKKQGLHGSRRTGLFLSLLPWLGPVKQELVHQKAVQIHFTKAILYSFI